MRKIPVWKTIAGGYSFAFGQLGTIIGLIWLPMVIVAVVGYFVMAQYYAAMPSAVEQGDPAAAGRAALIVIVWSLVSLLLWSMMYAAVTRQALGLRKGPALFSFQFGRTELRVFGAIVALVAIFAMFVAVYFLIARVVAGANPALGAGLGLIAIVYLGALMFVMVRLSFFLIPATIAEGRIGLARSWELSSGNFWRIVLIGLATLGPMLLVTAIAEILILGPGFFTPHHAAAGDTDAQLREMAAQMRAASPHMPVLYGFSFLIAPIVAGLALAPPAFAYLALKDSTDTN